ncbi:hypothetical protein DSM112329_02287 [Paraconexibacter sp. AEG42_29]|uniref:Uncharacterized protein n=1 Tax=Paraconexibacter sp. AEG42_29 TaxID=2997339 RepID=A0AAU7AUZ3_9ACTN
MKRTGLIAFTTTALLVATAGEAGAAKATACGDILAEGVTPTRVTAEGTTCKTARRVATRAAKVPSFGGCAKASRTRVTIKQPCRVLGYRCVTLKPSTARDSGYIRCAKGSAFVRFRF